MFSDWSDWSEFLLLFFLARAREAIFAVSGVNRCDIVGNQ